MNPFKRLQTTLLVAGAILLTYPAAQATTINATGVDPTRGEYNLWINGEGADMNTYFAGVIFIQLTAGNNTFNRDTLCVDLFTDIYLGQLYSTSLVLPYEIPGRDLDWVSWLVDNTLLPTQENTYSSLLPQSDWVTSAAQGAGIQLAIWDIVHDGGDGFTSGIVQQGSAAHPTDPTVLDWAKSYESLSAGHTSNDAFVYVNVSFGNGQPAQTLEGPMFLVDGGPQPAPECATFLMAGSVLIAAGLVRRKRRAR